MVYALVMWWFMAEALINVQNLDKSYTLGMVKTAVLRAVSLQIKQGEMVAIVGASGSGKSTLMNILGLLDQADQGSYFLAGNNVRLLSDDEKATYRNRYIGFIFQQFNLLPRLSAWQNVALPLYYRQWSRDTITEHVDQALARVHMQAFSHHRPNQLSGGQQQRIAIARALVTEPQVLLADEPTGALDSKTGSEVMALFHSLHKEGRTVVMITHDKEVAEQCQRQIRLVDGQIISGSENARL